MLTVPSGEGGLPSIMGLEQTVADVEIDVRRDDAPRRFVVLARNWSAPGAKMAGASSVNRFGPCRGDSRRRCAWLQEAVPSRHSSTSICQPTSSTV